MDGIHEDLNRVMMKPVWAPTPEQEAELERLPPQIASEREWRAWKARNDSLIVDYFQGQFRNRLECLTCHQVRRFFKPPLLEPRDFRVRETTSRVLVADDDFLLRLFLGNRPQQRTTCFRHCSFRFHTGGTGGYQSSGVWRRFSMKRSWKRTMHGAYFITKLNAMYRGRSSTFRFM